ncbi:MAG: hypothetical protein LBB13_01885, partial [Rickettsiales bacterium]|nr:hypothetical protein [Rickettsiales bacterium]
MTITKLANFVFRSSLAVVAILGTGEIARAKDVSDFYGLSNAIAVGEENIINVKQDITFNDAIIIERGNLTISGPGGGEVKLDEVGQHRFFTIGEDQKNISLKNLHLDGGHDNERESIYNSEKQNLIPNPMAGGGAINLRKGTKVILENITFSNSQTAGGGGAICSQGTDNDNRNSLNFTGKTTFDGNKTIGIMNGGGAISVVYSSLTFGGLAIFENNRARYGGAIFASDGSSIEFNNGLLLIENTTKKADSGAIDMYGSENELAIITIIQRNPLVPTEFRGNTSEDGGHNAIYMTRYSQLNLTAHDGSIDIFDDFSGNREGPDNIITIYKGE